MDDFDLFNDNLELFFIRLFIALLLSGIIGFERELKNHSAGFRTHILVGIGSCLMMLLSLYGFEEFISDHDNVRFDPSRLPSYVISGIGFLGAGTIIVNGMTIRGLTTAASIWTVAGLGLVVGAGMYDVAVLATILVLLSLIFLNNLEKKYFSGYFKNSYVLLADERIETSKLLGIFDEEGISLQKVEIENLNNKTKNILIQITKGQKINEISLLEKLSKVDNVLQVEQRR
ncbi:MgtC/SapB family protein [Halobacillus shinanisalinarum]|uniref:MgtC/SapB family protein n=1 Tax=Halobacillus shinanisalinarum TaxID=2932258 RepID=A0ABY4GTV1_9BACI|nr:MgtC/SapB family protein [Halobacillus shinanisalinarum]UOQ91381.1 MgtC/SapB family protein [Halobacillus shinanisalinarum]